MAPFSGATLVSGRVFFFPQLFSISDPSQVNVNAKTQPLCVTPSQQFCRPTPLDLTSLIASKKARHRLFHIALGGGFSLARLVEPLKNRDTYPGIL